MSARWWTDSEQARDLLARINVEDGAAGAGAALLGMHAFGRSALADLATDTAVDTSKLRRTLAEIDDTPARQAWSAVRDDYDTVRADAVEGAVEMVDAMTSAGVAWPLALQRAAAGFGLPPGEASVYAGKMSVPVLPPAVVDDSADVMLGAWASREAAKTQETISKTEEDWVEVRVRGRKVRRRVLRDDEGQFAVQGAAEEVEQEQVKAREFDGQRISVHEFAALSDEEKAAYLESRQGAQEKRRHQRNRRNEAAKRQAAKLEQRNAEREQMGAEMRARAAEAVERRDRARAAPKGKQIAVDAKALRAEQRKQQARQVRQEISGRVRRNLLAERLKMSREQLLSTTPLGAESDNVNDSLAVAWPVGYPLDTPDHFAGMRHMMDKLLQHVSYESSAEIEHDVRNPSSQQQSTTWLKNTLEDQQPVLWIDLYGLSMLLSAKERDDIPAASFLAAEAARRFNDQGYGARPFTHDFEFFQQELEKPMFQITLERTSEPILKSGNQVGNPVFAIPLKQVRGVVFDDRPGQEEEMTPGLDTSFEFTEDTKRYLMALTEFVLTPGGNGTDPILALLNDRYALNDIVWWSRHGAGVREYLTYHTKYPDTAVAANEQFERVKETGGRAAYDPAAEHTVLHERRRLMEKAIAHELTTGYGSERVYDLDRNDRLKLVQQRMDYLLRCGDGPGSIAGSLNDPLKGLDTDEFDLAPERFVQKYAELTDIVGGKGGIGTIGSRYETQFDFEDPGLDLVDMKHKLNEMRSPQFDPDKYDALVRHIFRRDTNAKRT